ncbi:CAP domain-containing protein [Planosporangium mesophilum]|nr:CAP domain-containing protein [Planosporangium mesophilum]NJC81658.1 CAP domain-containing protein [Planosporangium mesophilum]
MNASDPWAHTAPLPRSPYQDPYGGGAYGSQPYGDPRYGSPPSGGGPDPAGEEAKRRLSPLGIAGMVGAIVISIGLMAVLLRPVFASKSTATPNLPGLLDQPPAATLAPQSDPEIPVPTESPSATPSPTRSAAPTPRQAAGNAQVEDAVVALVNGVRRKAKCDPVRNDRRLREAARQHSADMAAGGFLSSTGSDGSSAADRMRAAGHDDPLSENLARGPESARDVVARWLDSREQRRNILDCDARSVGVGVVVSVDGTPYWTQDFGQ